MSKVLGVAVSLYYRYDLPGLFVGDVGRVVSLRLVVGGEAVPGVGVEEGVRVSPHHQVQLGYVLRQLQVNLVARVSQGDDDVDTSGL